MKAFLSHSSADNQFVSAVAHHLGRQYCIYDNVTFDSSAQFKDQIAQGMDDSTLFVLFASASSLKSLWVDWETDEAWSRTLQRTMSHAVVYLLDSSVDVKDIPSWLGRTKMRQMNSPNLVARDIMARLDELLMAKQNAYFVGRHAEVADCEMALASVGGGAPPRCLALSGLPGIGRRSILRRVASSQLRLKIPVEVVVSEGDTINDICLKVAERVAPYNTDEGLRRMFQTIEQMSEKKALERVMADLRQLASCGQYPVLVDDGGIVGTLALVSPPIASILNSLLPNDLLYIFLVLIRRTDDIGVPLPKNVSVGPMSKEETKLLLHTIAPPLGVSIQPSEASELAEYVAGYPPSAYFVVHQARQYGMSVVMADKTRLLQFMTTAFMKHLARFSLEDLDKEVLRVLTSYSPLPVAALARALSTDAESMARCLTKLIDMSLVRLHEDSSYGLSEPLVTAAARTFGRPDDALHNAMAEALNYLLSSEDELASRLQLNRHFFRAARMSQGSKWEREAIHLLSDMLGLAKEFYREREYGKAEDILKAALKERPSSTGARQYLVNSLIQQEKWEEAQSEIDAYRKFANAGDVEFTKGFLERKRDNYASAVEHLERARRLGKRGPSLVRELARSLLLSGDLDRAASEVDPVVDRGTDNPFLLDLAAEVAIRRRDFARAERLIVQLEVLEPRFGLYRKSRLRLRQGQYKDAEEAAKQAVGESRTPLFEVLAQLALSQMWNGKLDDAASTLEKLRQRYPSLRQKAQLGLQCRLQIRRGNFRLALELSDRIGKHGSRTDRSLRLAALKGELETAALPDAKRVEYENEVTELEASVADIDENELATEHLGHIFP